MKKYILYIALAGISFSSCEDDKNEVEKIPSEYALPQELIEQMTYSAGELGTTFNETAYAYQQPTPATEMSGMAISFKYGETLFERDFVQTPGTAFSGLGPVMVRNGCLYCHPAYGHGKRQERYRANDMGNGYLLVFYDKQTNAYIRSVAGMPQTLAVAPFKAPVDETKINIEWKHYTDEWGNKFDDGESYSLIYPEVTTTADAFYAPIIAARNGQNVEIPISDLGIRLESTIGIYGTGITDAIPDDSITAQWVKESKYFATLNDGETYMNPGYWDSQKHEWISYYKGLTGKQYVRRYTYAMTRGPILDAAGANAIWNITNVTRKDRAYHYLDLNYQKGKPETSYYAQTAANDPEVQASFYDYFPEWNKTGNVHDDILAYLCSTELPAEMDNDDYKDFMVWHRGLAVPAARDVETEEFQRGYAKFVEIGCAACHRPSWKTGDDNIQDPNGLYGNADMPRYPNQTIWPYTDFVQHKLYMENDIRTGWCRTTPLWGRGLSKLCTGAEDRLHDCRARNTMEAIMWHGNQKSHARHSVEGFRRLKKEDRDAVIMFIESI